MTPNESAAPPAKPVLICEDCNHPIVFHGENGCSQIIQYMDYKLGHPDSDFCGCQSHEWIEVRAAAQPLVPATEGQSVRDLTRDELLVQVQAEMEAHCKIADMCFEAGASTDDGTSVGAVRGLVAKLAQARREAEIQAMEQWGECKCDTYNLKHVCGLHKHIAKLRAALAESQQQAAPREVCPRCGLHGIDSTHSLICRATPATEGKLREECRKVSLAAYNDWLRLSAPQSHEHIADAFVDFIRTRDAQVRREALLEAANTCDNLWLTKGEQLGKILRERALAAQPTPAPKEQ
jgi:hypothetical protein